MALKVLTGEELELETQQDYSVTISKYLYLKVPITCHSLKEPWLLVAVIKTLCMARMRKADHEQTSSLGA